MIGGGLGKELSFAHGLCFSPLSCWQWSPSGSQFLLCSYVLDPPLNPPPVQVIASCWYMGNACSSWSENTYKIKWGWVRLTNVQKKPMCLVKKKNKVRNTGFLSKENYIEFLELWTSFRNWLQTQVPACVPEQPRVFFQFSQHLSSELLGFGFTTCEK